MANILYATERLIDSVWTLEYELINDDQIKIISFNRDNPIGYEKETELPRVRLVEDDKRTVLSAYFEPYAKFKYLASPTGKQYEVVNPRYIFKY